LYNFNFFFLLWMHFVVIEHFLFYIKLKFLWLWLLVIRLGIFRQYSVLSHLSADNWILIIKLYWYTLNVLWVGVKFLMVGSTLWRGTRLNNIGHQFKNLICFLQFWALHHFLVLLQEVQIHLMFLSCPMSYFIINFKYLCCIGDCDSSWCAYA